MGQTTSTTTSASTGPTLTKAELIAKGDAICRRLNAKRSAISIATSAQYVADMPRIAADQKTAVIVLSKLTPPASLASDWQIIVSGNRTIEEIYVKVGAAVRANEFLRAHNLLASRVGAQTKVTSTAQRDGLKNCATFT